MSVKRSLLVVLVLIISIVGLPLAAGLWSPSVRAERTEHVPAETWTFQGRVYAGEVGDESHPLQGVTISVYGGYNPHPDEGTLIRTTTTNGDGWYGLPVYDDDGPYEFYHIRETDPAGHTSVGATSAAGTVRSGNWIEYVIPLTGKTLTGNKFWDVSSPDIPLGAVPPESHRQAAQLVEIVRGSDIAPGWERARVAPVVRPLYRPDVEGIAYYEFRVEVESAPAGFIIISTGGHDFPIPHWNFSGTSPTQDVEAKAADAGLSPIRYYKLDALDYAAEDATGQLAATLGTLPHKVSGMDPAWLDAPVELTEVTWTPAVTTTDDMNPPSEWVLSTMGPVTSSLQLGGWESWDALKVGYIDSYGVLLEDLRRDAAEDWEVEHLAQEFGEGLYRGDIYTLALLCESTPAVSATGPGVEFVQTQLLLREGLSPAYRITVVDSIPGQELPLDVTIECPGKPVEAIRFVIIEQPVAVYMPLVGDGSGGQGVQAQGVQKTEGYAAYWAWARTGQMTNYRQFTFYPPPGISSCPSGCGATAWAMLFGWADFQAANPHWSYWRPRWGIFRQNGGKGQDIQAPLPVTSGVKNITWEIREDIASWCAFGSTPTFVWDMDQAAYYFKDRTGTKLYTNYNVLGIRERRLREYSRNSILHRRTPAIIGTGWLKHYPLAYGYQWWSRKTKKCFFWCWWETEYNRQFWVNQGWGGSGNGWISAGTWFNGEILP